MRKPVPFLFNDPVNEQFDKLILNDQKRTIEKATDIPSDAEIFQCSNSVIEYNLEMHHGRGFFKSILESRQYTHAAKIQFIKDVLADTSREEHDGDPVGKFTFTSCSFWHSSKEGRALINGAFDKQIEKIKASEESEEFKKSEEEYIEHQRFEFVVRMQLPESYQMITDYIKNSPAHKWESEPYLVYYLVQMGKEKEGLDYLEIIIEDLIHDRLVRPYFSFNYGVFADYNLFYFLCLSEDEIVATRATDLLFRLLSKKVYDPYILKPLAIHIDKVRYDEMMDKWFAFYSAIDFSKVPECDKYVYFMKGNLKYLLDRYGKRFWEELLSKSIYTEKKSGSFEAVQLEYLEYLFKHYPYTDNQLQQMLLQAIKTTDLFKPEYKEQYLKLVSMAWPGGNISKADFDKLQLDKLLAYSSPLTLKAFNKEIGTSQIKMPEEKINELIADLNSVAVKCDLPEIRLNKLSKFLISDNLARNVIDEFLRMNNLIIEFHRHRDAPEGAPFDYVKVFKNKFSQVAIAQHCNDFTIGQVTTSIGSNEHNYNLFVQYNSSVYNFTYSELSTPFYTDAQRLVKMLNLCLIENKERKRFVARNSSVAYEFVLMEPAAIMPLSKKYNLGFFAIEEGDH